MIVKNAWKLISHSKGRNVLIGLIIFTVAVTSTIALSIMKAADDAKIQGLANTKITAQITTDRQKIMENMRNNSSSNGSPSFDRNSMPSLSLEQLQTYAEFDGVEDFYYTNTVSLSNAGNFAPITSSESNSSQSNGGQSNGARQLFGSESNADFSLTGYSSQAAMGDFVDGQKSLTDGVIFSFTDSAKQCLISSTLATQNGTKVGDTITLKNPLKSSETYKLKVVGIYKSTEENQSANQSTPLASQDSANAILVSTATVSDIILNSAKNPETSSVEGFNGQSREQTSKFDNRINGTFVLPSQETYNQFNSELKTAGLSDDFVLQSSDITKFEQSILPLEQLSNFALTLLIIVLIIGAVVLVVLNLFNIRERKYEVGVFTAIGMRKSKVALQFICELLIVTIMAISVGAFVGSVSSVPISNSMLASQIQQVETKQTEQTRTFGGPESAGAGTGANPNAGQMPRAGGAGGGPLSDRTANQNTGPVSYISQISTSVNINILLELLIIGLALSLIATVGQMIFVLRYEPLQILADRN
ncbi:MAG: ABC transporter permease [Bifidobacteriaceae bacterium]|jgi:putative ABC transport system permease protein|nr:ABC transporter permease [Bifidobacteriaceae bacterium]